MNYQFNKEKHIHLLDGKPLCGTSTVLSVVAKPLTWWASGLAVAKLGWTNPKKTDKATQEEALKMGYELVKGLDIDGYKKLLDEAYRAHSVKLTDSAEAGTDMHETLENFVKGRLEGKDMHLEGNLKCFEEWVDKNVDKFLWSEANTYSEKLWVGGITDCGALLKNGEKCIIDFKSSKEAYTSQFLQIAGYDLQIGENGLLTNDGKVVSVPIQDIT